MRITVIFLLLVCSHFSIAQNFRTAAGLLSEGVVGTADQLPFWFVHNRSGKFRPQGNTQFLQEGYLLAGYHFTDRFKVEGGADFAWLVSDKGTDWQIVELFATAGGKYLRFQGGAFAEPEILGGLSSTNGELLHSLNSRPYPRVQLSTNGYIPVPFGPRWLRFKAQFDEGWLNDNRIVEKPHLHHKQLMFQIVANSRTTINAGGNHYVFWGGTSPQYGALPSGIKNYFRYITGRSGNAAFPETDQQNVAGNQLGSYLITLEKKFSELDLEVRINHPFEDRSGMRFENWRDNLYTLYLRFRGEKPLVGEVLAEYCYTRHQSGDRHQLDGPRNERMRGLDNYFNHGVYQTGFTYRGFIIGTPLFGPVTHNVTGMVAGVSNNRISAWHLGAKGNLSEQIRWKGLASYSQNSGTYAQPFDPVRRQVAGYGEVSCSSRKLPLVFTVLLAADFGTMVSPNWGAGLRMAWTLR